MSSPINNNLASPSPSSSAVELPERQRIHKAVEQLTPAKGAVRPPEREELVKQVEQVNEAMRPYGVQFEMNEEASRIITHVVDRESGEIIRQIPAEAVLKIAENLGEFQGLLLRQEA